MNSSKEEEEENYIERTGNLGVLPPSACAVIVCAAWKPLVVVRRSLLSAARR